MNDVIRIAVAATLFGIGFIACVSNPEADIDVTAPDAAPTRTDATDRDAETQTIELVVLPLLGFIDVSISHSLTTDIDDTVWRIVVTDDDDHVVTDTTVATSDFGAPGALLFVGQCDPFSDYNTVSVRLVAAYNDGKPVPGPLPALWRQKRATCDLDVDVFVAFDLSSDPRRADPLLP